ncbi:GIY-YIG nuclease family protein [Streptomyces sp. NPDC059783]|uniref:GIY-YIG nuclease family protein n=1 Tax=Streptomyces sp. NPDC059783 TaxID=3346944 RepID=UPI003666A50B
MALPASSEGAIPHPGVGTDDEASVYRVYDASGALLYVGMGRNPMNRWASHSAQHAWWHRARSYRVEWFATRKEALAEELRAIREEAPECNIHSVPGWGKEMYATYLKKLEANRARHRSGTTSA